MVEASFGGARALGVHLGQRVTEQSRIDALLARRESWRPIVRLSNMTAEGLLVLYIVAAILPM
jgi:hypothetical protein